MTARRLRPRDDEGASLVLALIFITASSLVVGAVLTYTSTALRSAGVTYDAVRSTTDAGGALQTAINDIRNSDYFNSPTSTTPCLSTGNRKTYPAMSADGGEPMTVSCEPAAGTGGDSKLLGSGGTLLERVPLRVYLSAWTCPTLPTPCAAPPSRGNGWALRGRALVEYSDGDLVVVPGSRRVDVKAWHVAR